MTRTQEGKNFAKIHDLNFKEGRPQKFTEEQIQFAYELKQQGMTYKMVERKTSISIATQKRRFMKITKNKSIDKEYRNAIIELTKICGSGISQGKPRNCEFLGFSYKKALSSAKLSDGAYVGILTNL